MRNPVHDEHAINTAMKWMQPLTSAWMGVVRKYRADGVAEAMTGAKLTELVCKYMRKLFTVHRNLFRAIKNIRRAHAGPTACETCWNS